METKEEEFKKDLQIYKDELFMYLINNNVKKHEGIKIIDYIEKERSQS